MSTTGSRSGSGRILKPFSIEAAVNGRAEMIVTHNVRHLEGPARRFGIPVFRPGEVLMRIRS
jgi:hypothetical protein